MDIKTQITDAVNKITKDKNMQEKFKKDPIKTVKEVTGVDLPDDTVKKIVDGVKGKLNVDKLSGALDGVKKLF